jgi:lycopene cyclase CruA
MQQLLYLEIPTPDLANVRLWLHDRYVSEEYILGESKLEKFLTPDGFVLRSPIQVHTQLDTKLDTQLDNQIAELCVFVWSLQRTTYLKAFRWTELALPQEQRILQDLTQQIRTAFPPTYAAPSEAIATDLVNGVSIFTALSADYPLTVKYFQKLPNGEYDLNRVYWWEKRWRESVCNPQKPEPVVFRAVEINSPKYDLIYIGGALGIIHAAMMAKLGYKVCLIERLPFARMNREWNISRAEFQGLVDFGLFSQAEFESIILREYEDGFNKFFDGNNPANAKAKVLHTPTVLNVAIASERLLKICGEKLRAFGGEIFDQTEFSQVLVSDRSVTVKAHSLVNSPAHSEPLEFSGRLLIDAMGSASAIAQQINNGKAFDSVCPTVGAVLEGIDPQVWDKKYGDVLFTHGDISRGRQLIWELFPGENNEIAVYLFHYHQVNPANPGSLLEMYEDFFHILPEYRQCDMEQLVWKKATFGYIPGHFSLSANARQVAFDRLLAIGDAASLQSPLVFTGFGSLVRNLPRLSDLLDTALRHDLLKAEQLQHIRAYQSNVAVTWLFSKGMMVPTGRTLPPERINSMLNSFFGVMADQEASVSDRFIKDRLGWGMFNRLAIIAAIKNPQIIPWIWNMAGSRDMARWLVSYFWFTVDALLHFLLGGWLPQLIKQNQWLEPKYPKLWLKLLSWSYGINYSIGKPTATNSTSQS